MTIYAIAVEDSRRVKIGYTGGDPLLRLKDLQTGSPDRMYLLAVYWGATRTDERATHARFSAHHIRGEWFTLAPAIEAWAAGSSLGSASFWQWLSAQELRGGPVGDLAEDVARSLRLAGRAIGFRRPPIESNTLEDWLAHLGLSSCAGARTALRQAFEEWRGFCAYSGAL